MQNALNRQHEMHGRVRALESMEADFSGFYSGVKEILVAKKSGKLTGIDGAVAELISVEKEYIKAVETALGGAMQHIVTATEAEARKAIGLFKSEKCRKGNFPAKRCDEIQEASISCTYARLNSIRNS